MTSLGSIIVKLLHKILFIFWYACPLLQFFCIYREEDFSLGINSFIKCAVSRRKQRKAKEKVEEADVGIENRIIGCATYEKKYM